MRYFIQHKESMLAGAAAGFAAALLVAAGSVWLIKENSRLLPQTLSHAAGTTTASAVRELVKEKETVRYITQEAVVIDAVRKTKPAVVSIVITKDVPVVERYFENYDPFRDLFGDEDSFGFGPWSFQMPRERQQGTEKREVGGGTGFLISRNGLAVTNKHVVDDDKADYTALANDGKKYGVEVVAKDPVLDVAIIRLKGVTTLPYLEFADSDNAEVGQTAIAIGNALGEFRNTVSVGVISGLSRSIVAQSGWGKTEQLDEVIQTDAAINPGNSGGPLLNTSGKVIGVSVAVAGGAQNVGFALPANVVKGIAESVEKYGKIVRPFLGIRYTAVTKTLKEKNNLSVDYGVLVVRGASKDELAVIPGSPADKAGIVENDIILEVDSVKLTDEKNLAAIVRRHKVGDTITLKLFHKGETKTVSIKLEDMKN